MQNKVNLWNSLPHEAWMATNVDGFKRQLEKFAEMALNGYQLCLHSWRQPCFCIQVAGNLKRTDCGSCAQILPAGFPEEASGWQL